MGELTKNDRSKIIMLVTLDVHARDVVQVPSPPSHVMSLNLSKAVGYEP